MPRPADECPFQRPFPADFNTCVAYRPGLYVGLDMSYRPLVPVWTCRHLEVRRQGPGGGGFYAACSLGDEHERHRWTALISNERLQAVRALGLQLGVQLRPMAEELWALKGRQLMVTRTGMEGGELTQELDLAAGQMMEKVEEFLSERRTKLSEVDIPFDACVDLCRAALDHMIRQTSTDDRFKVPAHILQRFPETVQALLQPEPTG